MINYMLLQLYTLPIRIPKLIQNNLTCDIEFRVSRLATNHACGTSYECMILVNSCLQYTNIFKLIATRILTRPRNPRTTSGASSQNLLDFYWNSSREAILRVFFAVVRQRSASIDKPHRNRAVLRDRDCDGGEQTNKAQGHGIPHWQMCLRVSCQLHSDQSHTLLDFHKHVRVRRGGAAL